jgi:hypothetical protein
MSEWWPRFLDDEGMWVFFPDDLQLAMVIDRDSEENMSVPVVAEANAGDADFLAIWIGRAGRR